MCVGTIRSADPQMMVLGAVLYNVFAVLLFVVLIIASLKNVYCHTFTKPSVDEVSKHSPLGCIASEHTTPSCACTLCTTPASTSSQYSTRPVQCQKRCVCTPMQRAHPCVARPSPQQHVGTISPHVALTHTHRPRMLPAHVHHWRCMHIPIVYLHADDLCQEKRVMLLLYQLDLYHTQQTCGAGTYCMTYSSHAHRLQPHNFQHTALYNFTHSHSQHTCRSTETYLDIPPSVDQRRGQAI